MTDPSDRLRQHPDERFEPAVHQLDLSASAGALLAEPLPDNRSHRQETLYRRGPVTVALFLFERGAGLPAHRAEGVVTVQVLSGRIRMSAEGKNHELCAGQMLVMAPGVQHDVQAEEASRMLLTVCMEPKA